MKNSENLESHNSKTFGYDDSCLVNAMPSKWNPKKIFTLVFAVLFIVAVWLALDQKLLFGENWLSETYDNTDWKTNEGDLHTFGAWDLETHIWKTEYILNNFPNFQWNPYWYLGMPLLKYYQSGFYFLNIAASPHSMLQHYTPKYTRHIHNNWHRQKVNPSSGCFFAFLL